MKIFIFCLMASTVIARYRVFFNGDRQKHTKYYFFHNYKIQLQCENTYNLIIIKFRVSSQILLKHLTKDPDTIQLHKLKFRTYTRTFQKTISHTYPQHNTNKYLNNNSISTSAPSVSTQHYGKRHVSPSGYYYPDSTLVSNVGRTVGDSVCIGGCWPTHEDNSWIQCLVPSLLGQVSLLI